MVSTCSPFNQGLETQERGHRNLGASCTSPPHPELARSLHLQHPTLTPTPPLLLSSRIPSWTGHSWF